MTAQSPRDMTEEARSVRLESEISRREIKLSAGITERCGPCPVCGGFDRFSINLKKQVWNCRGCACGGDIIALVRHLDGLSFGEAVRLLAGGAAAQKPAAGARRGIPGHRDSGAPARAPQGPPDNRAPGMAIWNESRDPRGTLVQAYLDARRVGLPDEAANLAIRFHPDCWFERERFPAMVCLVRNIITNEPQAIHRTALTPEGRAVKRPDKAGRPKTFRMSLGPASGGAIKLDPDEDVTQGLCIGEGVETCLAGRQMGFQPVWCAVNKDGVKKFPVLPGIDGLHIFKENDPNGASAEAVETCARRWYEAGRDVIIVEPDIGSNDLNDELRKAAG